MNPWIKLAAESGPGVNPPASQPPPPPPSSATAAPPPPSSTRKVHVGWRVLAVVYAVLFGIFAVAFTVEGIQVAGEPDCAVENGQYVLPPDPSEDECIVSSSGSKYATVGLLIGAGVLGIVSAACALILGITGNRRYLKAVLGALVIALVLYGLGVAIGVDVLQR